MTQKEMTRTRERPVGVKEHEPWSGRDEWGALEGDQKHPEVRAVWSLVAAAERRGLIQTRGIEGTPGHDRHADWSAVCHGIYGSAARGRAIVVQQRESWAGWHGHTEVRKTYFLLWRQGHQIHIEAVSAATVRAAIRQDIRPASAIRALSELLPTQLQHAVEIVPTVAWATVRVQPHQILPVDLQAALSRLG